MVIRHLSFLKKLTEAELGLGLLLCCRFAHLKTEEEEGGEKMKTEEGRDLTGTEMKGRS